MICFTPIGIESSERIHCSSSLIGGVWNRQALSVHGLLASAIGVPGSHEWCPSSKVIVIDDSVRADMRSSSSPSSTNPPNRESKRHPSSTRMEMPSEHLLPRSIPCESSRTCLFGCSDCPPSHRLFAHIGESDLMAVGEILPANQRQAQVQGLPRAVQIAGANISVLALPHLVHGLEAPQMTCSNGMERPGDWQM